MASHVGMFVQQTAMKCSSRMFDQSCLAGWKAKSNKPSTMSRKEYEARAWWSLQNIVNLTDFERAESKELRSLFGLALVLWPAHFKEMTKGISRTLRQKPKSKQAIAIHCYSMLFGKLCVRTDYEGKARTGEAPWNVMCKTIRLAKTSPASCRFCRSRVIKYTVECLNIAEALRSCSWQGAWFRSCNTRTCSIHEHFNWRHASFWWTRCSAEACQARQHQHLRRHRRHLEGSPMCVTLKGVMRLHRFHRFSL